MTFSLGAILTPYIFKAMHPIVGHRSVCLLVPGSRAPFLHVSLCRKVLSKLNFSIPEEVVRKIAQCTPGVVELVLIPLRQKIEEKQRQAKVSSNSYQVRQVARRQWT